MPLPAIVAIPALWATAIAFLVNSARAMIASNVGRWAIAVLAYVGISFVVQEAVVTNGLDVVRSYFPSSGVAADWLAFLNFDKACSMIMGAYASAALLRGAKVRLTKPTPPA